MNVLLIHNVFTFLNQYCYLSTLRQDEGCTVGSIAAKFMGFKTGPLVNIWDCCCKKLLCNSALSYFDKPVIFRRFLIAIYLTIMSFKHIL